MKYILTGGSGLLGTELQKQAPDLFFAPTHSEMDINASYQLDEYFNQYFRDMETVGVLHAAAFTSPPKCEKNKSDAYYVNVNGTENIVNSLKRLECGVLFPKLVLISTDYVYDGSKNPLHEEGEYLAPVNYYAWTKAMQEIIVRQYFNHLIIRTTFAARKPWAYPAAYIDHYTSKDFVDVIAGMIIKLITTPLGLSEVVNVGTERKSLYTLAKRVSPEVRGMLIKDLSFTIPADTSMNCSKYWRLIGEDKL